jgi:hypothetical protein
MYVNRNAGFHKERIFQPQTLRIIPRPWDIRASIELSFSVKSELPFTLGDNSKWTMLVTGGWEVEQTQRWEVVVPQQLWKQRTVISAARHTLQE